MAADPIRLLSFCRAIEESSNNGLLALDRENLLAVHKALTVLRREIEQALSRISLDVQSCRGRSVPASSERVLRSPS
jgi:hypothetical protein